MTKMSAIFIVPMQNNEHDETQRTTMRFNKRQWKQMGQTRKLIKRDENTIELIRVFYQLLIFH